MKRLNKIKIVWNANFSYAIGLITTDGNLSKDGRHINFTSKDLELIKTFQKCLNIKNKIGKKGSGSVKEKKYFNLQFGDVAFYEFLNSIGLIKAKSKTLRELDIPNAYFADFFRGCLDGDGNISIFKHSESYQPQLKIRLYSASPIFLEWIKQEVTENFKIKSGWIQPMYSKGISALCFGKKDSIIILNKIYYKGVESFLKRKYNIIKTVY